VESEVGKGSTFTILLTEGKSPEKQAEEELMKEALKPMESSRPGSRLPKTGIRQKGRARILEIDDDADNRRLLTNQLEELRFEVITAASAEIGLKMAKEAQPDLITLDLLMPEMTGWEALKEFKGTPDLQDIPVVIISVVAGEQDRGSIFGAVDLLTKPIDPDDLAKVLRRNLREPRGGEVLVVEDEPGTQELFMRYLQDAGLRVTLAGNGEEAETALEGFTPDIIMLDLGMPVMDGTAFLGRLREHPTRAKIPVIICTGTDVSGEERERLLSQATEIMAKGDDFEANLMTVLARFFPSDERPSSTSSEKV